MRGIISFLNVGYFQFQPIKGWAERKTFFIIFNISGIWPLDDEKEIVNCNKLVTMTSSPIFNSECQQLVRFY